MDLTRKRILITGASSGIGEELALQLAQGGAKLALAARRTERLQQVADKCRERGGEAVVIQADVSEEAQCARMVAEAVAQLGGLDVLIVNAGVSMYARFEEITDVTVFERLMRVNYLGAVWSTFHALPHIKASRGAIVAVSSLTGKAGVPTRTAYAASKHAMHGFYDSLRAELHDSGVQITLVCPGFVDTEVRQHALGGNGNAITDNPVDESKSMTAAECARITLDAVRAGKREEVMTLLGKVGVYVRPFAPGLIDAVARRKVRRTAR